MGAYIQVEFPVAREEESSILIAQLSEMGFEGFEESEKSLKAFITAKEYDEPAQQLVVSPHNILFSKTIIEETNWNRLWESNFNPVIVDDFVAICADFHQEIKGTEHEIIITPKMSFGTGHHATTYTMIRQMRQIDFCDKTVFDFGTGTGVLAILAEKLGAKKVIAIDNDEWSIENAGENIRRNGCSLIQLMKTGSPDVAGLFDVILANINKNVIVDNFSGLVQQLKTDGVLVLSGLLTKDTDDVFRKMAGYFLQLKQTIIRQDWVCILVTH